MSWSNTFGAISEPSSRATSSAGEGTIDALRRAMRVLLLMLVVACGDPLGPSATGTVDIAPGVDVTPYTRLVVQLVPADGSANEAAALDDIPTPGSWPLDFAVGGDIDARAVAKTYSVEAWLATVQGTVSAPDGAPYASTTVVCCEATDVTLVLAE